MNTHEKVRNYVEGGFVLVPVVEAMRDWYAALVKAASRLALMSATARTSPSAGLGSRRVDGTYRQTAHRCAKHVGPYGTVVTGRSTGWSAGWSTGWSTGVATSTLPCNTVGSVAPEFHVSNGQVAR